MNKEYLEALERLAMPDELHIKECKRLGIGLTDDYDLIKKALFELKVIKEANPSQAMGCLHWLGKHRIEFSEFLAPIEDTSEYNVIKQALLKAQENEKILKFVFEKNINIERFKSDLLIIGNFTYRYYVNNFGNYHSGLVVKLLTEEEFNLLKEMLQWKIKI